MRSCETVERLVKGCNVLEKTFVNEKYFMYWFNNSDITETDYEYWKREYFTK